MASSSAPSAPPPPLRSSRGDDEEGDVCPVCFEPFTVAEEHRPATLLCGHVFGSGCIRRWLRSQGKAATCPKCNKKAKRSDVVLLYGVGSRPVDNSSLRRALEEEQSHRRRAELELQTVTDTCMDLRRQLQVREFERETLERIRLVIVPDSESDSLESPVRPRRVRVARKRQRKSVMTFKWDDVLAEVYGKPKVKSPTPHPDDLHRDEGYGSLARPAFREPTIRPSKILPTPEVCKYVLAMNCKDTLKTLYIAKQLI